MKSKIIITTLSAALAISSHAATITTSNDPGGSALQDGDARAVFNIAGNAYLGGYIGIGYFTSMPDFTTMPGNEISPLFSQFGDSGSFNYAGYPVVVPGLFSLSGSASIVAGGINSSFIGQNITLVFGDGTSIADSTELWAFQSASTFEADAPEFSFTLDMTGPTPSGTLLFGSQDFEGGTITLGDTVLATASNSFQTAELVPEPSTALVGLLGVGLLALRRRRD